MRKLEGRLQPLDPDTLFIKSTGADNPTAQDSTVLGIDLRAVAIRRHDTDIVSQLRVGPGEEGLLVA